MVSDTFLSRDSFSSSFLPSQPSPSFPSSLTQNLALLSPSFTPSTSIPSAPEVVSFTSPAVSSPSLPSSSSSSLSSPLMLNSSCFCFSSSFTSSSSSVNSLTSSSYLPASLPSSSQSFISSPSSLISPSSVSFTPFPFSSDISPESTSRLSLLDALGAQTSRRRVSSPQGLLAILAAQNNRHHAKSATDNAYNNICTNTMFLGDSPRLVYNNAAATSPQALHSFNGASTLFHDVNTNDVKLPTLVNDNPIRIPPLQTLAFCNRSGSLSEIAATHCGRFPHRVRVVECPSPPPPSPASSPHMSKSNSSVDMEGLMKRVTCLSGSVPRLSLVSPRVITPTALMDLKPKVDDIKEQINYDKFEEENKNSEDLYLSSSTSSFSVVLRTSCDASQTTITRCAVSVDFYENGEEEEKKGEDRRMVGGTKRSVSAPKALSSFLDVSKTCGEDSPRDSLMNGNRRLSCRNSLSNSIAGTVVSSSVSTSPTSLLSPLETDRTKVGSPPAAAAAAASANSLKGKIWKPRVSIDGNSVCFSRSRVCGNNGVGGGCRCKRRYAGRSRRGGGGNRNYFYPPSSYHQESEASSSGKCIANRMMDDLSSPCVCERNGCDMSFESLPSFDFSSLISPEIFCPSFGRRRPSRRWREGRESSQRRSISMPNSRKSTDADAERQNDIKTGLTRCNTTATSTSVGKKSSSSSITSWGSGDVDWSSYKIHEGEKIKHFHCCLESSQQSKWRAKGEVAAETGGQRGREKGNNREILRGRRSNVASEFSVFGGDVVNDDRRGGNDCCCCCQKSSDSSFVLEEPEKRNLHFSGN